MQSPSQEIHAVIDLVISPTSPDVQKAAVNKFFTSDAGFRNPVYAVQPGQLSRESILGIFQWYRTISPKIDVDVRDVVYDRLHNIVYVDILESWHFRLSPFSPVPVRVLSRFTLRKEHGLHYIEMQEDFLHSDDLAALLLPPLAPIVRMMLTAASTVSNVWTKSAQVLGIWRAPPGVDHVNVEEVSTKPYKPRPGEAKLRKKERREETRAIRRSQRRDQDEFGSQGAAVNTDEWDSSVRSGNDSLSGGNSERFKGKEAGGSGNKRYDAATVGEKVEPRSPHHPFTTGSVAGPMQLD